MAGNNALRTQLDEHLGLMAQDSTAAKRQLKDCLVRSAQVPKGTVAVSLATGGTKQARNRLGQAEVQRASQLALFILGEDDSIEKSTEFVVDAINGRNNARKPIGPVAFAIPRPNGQSAVALVEGRPTKLSRLFADAFGIRSIDPRESIAPKLPAGGSRWLLMSNGETFYGDRDGIRYHFPTGIPNGRQVRSGDIVVTARTKGSGGADAGAVFGIGRVGRRVEVDEGQRAFAYFDRFKAVDPPILLADLGDPLTNVNSIVGLTDDWLSRLMREVGVADAEEMPVPITALDLDGLVKRIRSDGLVFAESLISSVLAAIRSGKHIMLTGAPGTGKTSLALSIAGAANDAALCEEVLLTTGSADWTSADTVGAYRMTKDQQLRFHAGHVVMAIDENRWLVIDELNRADIDKAIGQLFTALSGQAVTLPFEEHDPDLDIDTPVSIVPPGQDPPVGTSPKMIAQNWRLIATLNDRDRDLLFDMSEALMRRFAIIEVPAPSRALWAEIASLIGGTGREDWDAAMSSLVASPEFRSRPLGVAVLLDAVRHLREIIYLHDELTTMLDPVAALQEALDIYVVPQLGTAGESVSVDAKRLLSEKQNVDEAAAGEILT